MVVATRMRTRGEEEKAPASGAVVSPATMYLA